MPVAWWLKCQLHQQLIIFYMVEFQILIAQWMYLVRILQEYRVSLMAAHLFLLYPLQRKLRLMQLGTVIKIFRLIMFY